MEILSHEMYLFHSIQQQRVAVSQAGQPGQRAPMAQCGGQRGMGDVVVVVKILGRVQDMAGPLDGRPPLSPYLPLPAGWPLSLPKQRLSCGIKAHPKGFRPTAEIPPQ